MGEKKNTVHSKVKHPAPNSNKKSKKHQKPASAHCKSRKLTAFKIAASAFGALILIFIFIMYGPYKGLSDLYITTAMHTSDHTYLATMLYSDKYIAKVLERNKITEIPGLSNPIAPSLSDEKSNSTQLIEIKEPGFSGYLLKVSDPSKIDILHVDSSDGVLIEDIALQSGAAAAINASGYVDNAHTGTPNGMVIYDHQLVHESDREKHSFFAIDDEGILHFGMLSTEEILAQNYRSLIEFGPVLLLNGEMSEISGYGIGVSARTAIGQASNGEVLMLVIDGLQPNSLGATLGDVQRIMAQHGAVNAIALDGGSSSSMFYNGAVINNPFHGDIGRFIPNAIVAYGDRR